MAESRTRSGATVVAADLAILDQFTQKLSLVGVVDGCACGSFPAPFQFYAVAKLWGLPVTADSSCVLRLVDLGTGEVMGESPVHTLPAHPEGQAPGIQHTAVHQFAGEFPHAGMFAVQVDVAGSILASYPVAVAELVTPQALN